MKKYDAAIVLGGGINLDGTLPEWAERRVDKAAELYRLGEIEKIIVSGGFSRKVNGKRISEAKAMAKYLAGQAIPGDAIIEEDKSNHTVENAILSKKYLDANKWYNPVIITSEFHMHRSEMIFKAVLDLCYNPGFVAASDQGIDSQEFKKILKKEDSLNECIKSLAKKG